MAAFPPTSAPARGPAAYGMPMAASTAPAGIFAPGTKVTVGSHRVVVDRYLSEGGFAHVYVVRVPTASGGSELAVLKRVAVPDKDALANMRTEVETMKKLKGHRKIVTYFDSHASQLKGGGYEVFLLMEFCDGGGLIDFMNTRLKNRLTEPEILKIFSDTAEGVACMHYLKPPLLHRDLKVENILISSKNSSPIYKLCDFGSTAPPRPAATSVAEGRLIEDDVQKHTTMQYRSPEMIDVYRKRPIDEKSDIWALGVLLYKLCYYTTPFEEQGQMAILTASFKFPGYPRFSDRVKALIATMLSEDPLKRPNIYQVIKEVCAMRGREVPIKDIYSNRTQSEARSHQQLPTSESSVSASPAVGISKAPLETTKQVRPFLTRTQSSKLTISITQSIPEVAPMRRGRPLSSQVNEASTTLKKDRDPFAALDSPSFETRSKALDELSSRFPPAEQFSLLQDKQSSFAFNKPTKGDEKLKTRITNALADEAFAAASKSPPLPASEPSPNIVQALPVRDVKSSLPAISRSLPDQKVKKPVLDRPVMVSIGTMTGDSPNNTTKTSASPPKVINRPIWRVPTPKSDIPQLLEPLPPRTSSLAAEREANDSSVNSRRSVETLRPPILDISRSIHRSRSAEEQSLSPSKIDRFEHEIPQARPVSTDRRRSVDTRAASSSQNIEEVAAASSLDYLRHVEREDASKLHARKVSSSQNRTKHTSFPMSTGGARTSIVDRITGARRMFEGGSASRQASASSPGEQERPLVADDSSTDQNWNNNQESAIDETEEQELPPEMRRELERRRLSMEEKRVADAAAAYRTSVAQGNKSGPRTRASEIQSRVKTLLDESGRLSPVKKTASGYGKYTDSDRPVESQPKRVQSLHQPGLQRPTLDSANSPQHRQSSASSNFAAAPTKPARTVGAGRPSAPPKPIALRTGGVSQSQVIQTPIQGDRVGSDDVDLESDFSKRYPDLSFEMVETEVVAPPIQNRSLRVKDV